ncbi:MAG TPA: hypothetical protein VFJ58_15055 [Armatimonadota bacterium]|nr:hypothetical protein [Armatimonadota bacterium]
MDNAGGYLRFGLIFATAQEAGPLRARLSPFAVPSGLPRARAASYVLPNATVTLAIAGIGPSFARKIALEMLDSGDVDWIISAGVAGGLREDLKIGAVVEAAEVMDDNGMRWSARPIPAADPEEEIHRVVVYSSPVILSSPEQKRAARDRWNADVVDMEAAAIAAVAAQRGIRFSCVRSVSDALDDPLPLDFTRFLTPAGAPRLPLIVLHALTHPWLLPGLARLGFNSRTASRRLAETMMKSLLRLAAGPAAAGKGATRMNTA